MDNAQLTKKQKRFFLHIVTFIDDNQRFPTWQETQDHFGWSSPSAADNYYKELVKKGYLEKTGPGNYLITRRGLKLIRAHNGEISGVELAISPDTKLQNDHQGV
nr:hypothetical protein 17 [Balneolaceae bacterium]